MPDSLSDHWKLIGSVTGALTTCAGWLLKRRGSGTSWLSEQINVRKALIEAKRTIKLRDEEIAYLMAANERARMTAEAIQDGMLTSALKSARPHDDSTTSLPGSVTHSAHLSTRGPLGIP